MSPNRYPVIIIGAGIGGLTTAARLSHLGVHSLLIEQTAFLGGRCSTRVINGERYEIGALYLGGGVFDHLRKTFGLTCKTVPVRCGVKIGNNIISLPFGLGTLWALHRSGVPWSRLGRFFCQSRTLSHQDTFVRHKSAGDVLDVLLPDPVMHQFFEAILGVSGTSAYRLPSNYLSRSHPAVRYKALMPEAFREGNGTLATVLFESARGRCHLFSQVKVLRILVRGGCATGVETDRGNFEGDIIVSNTGLRTTVLNLTLHQDWPPEYYNEVAKTWEALSVVSIFLTFSDDVKLPRNYSVFFVPNELSREFQTLEEGLFPDLSSYILHVPSSLEGHGGKLNRATLQFYYPRKPVSSEQLKEQIHKIMAEGLERLCDGFSRSVTSYDVYDPMRYVREFGIAPYVFGVSPDLSCRRFSIETPIENLFCVGDSVGPDGPCVPQAMESGLTCAQMIKRKIGPQEALQ